MDISPKLANRLRKVFRIMNKLFMVPVFRIGLGALMGSPYGGYIMVVKTRGHKTGKIRYTPVNYALVNGQVYCIAGFGKVSHWYRNIEANAHAELLLPGGAWAAAAEVVTEPLERMQILRQILINSGFAAFAFGIHPSRTSEADLERLARAYILLRFRLEGIGVGPADPGGLLWLWPAAAILYLLWLWLG